MSEVRGGSRDKLSQARGQGWRLREATPVQGAAVLLLQEGGEGTTPREYQIELTQREPLEYKTRRHPITSSTLWRIPHLNNKQTKKYKPSHQQTGLHLTQPCPLEEKETNKQTKTQHKSHPIRSLHKPLDKT